ncbi:family 43 glycosylhydrolase [Lachnobacterium bovis]|uniref:Beta-xylosidase, GH43 family n=1 Tax=Lachnobacterium bovis TaxID=140626 RepID=A0A1H9T9G8_9FIRM|nr:family 43 glycosylhydrolase [Lachnobacterium bovis]SER93766.1 Beta-xylosidase, GH43 family [Lachnobacterium bovis]
MDKGFKYNEPWILQRADPFIVRHDDGIYYFTASVPAYDGICLRKSTTLEGLKDAKEVEIWHKHNEGPMSIHIWAPEMHYIEGKWYIYFAGGDKDDIWNIRPYVLECQGDDPINDSWKELGKMQSADEDEFSFKAFSLDATVFKNNGKWYYVWAEKVGVGKQISNLYIAEMEKPNKLKTVQVLLSTPDYDWERGDFWVDEGPAVIKKGNNIFLTFSASDTGPSYCIGMLKTTVDADLLDPQSWVKSRYPVVETDEKRNIYGPGHNSFTVDEDGNDIMVYHARTESKIVGDPLYNPNRHTQLMKINWSKDGMPIFSFI